MESEKPMTKEELDAAMAALRPWAATIKHGRTTHVVTGMAPTLDRADEIIRTEFGRLLSTSHRYLGVYWTDHETRDA